MSAALRRVLQHSALLQPPSTPAHVPAAVRAMNSTTRQTIRGVIFDMDGTLTVPVINFRDMRQRLNIPDGADILDTIAAMQPHDAARAAAIVEQIEDEALQRMQLMDGAAQLCSFLDDAGIPRGLVTRNIARSVDYFHKHHFPLAPFWPSLSREFTPYKPDPAPLLHIASTWRVAPHECIMIGDSAKDDIVAGNRAGMMTVLLDIHDAFNGHALPHEQTPRLRANSLADVLQLLREHCHFSAPECSSARQFG